MEDITVRSPRGVEVTLAHRPGTTDLGTIGSTFELWGKLNDEYELGGLYSKGTLVDIGAHIGTVAIAFLLDNPEAQAIAVEPLPENVALIKSNAKAAGVCDRLMTIEAAVGGGKVYYGPTNHRFIGNIGGHGDDFVQPEAISLSELAGYGPIAVLKTDCEGGEWALLDDPAVADIPLIFGEFHQRGSGPLHELLDETHEVDAEEGSTGLFRAVRR